MYFAAKALWWGFLSPTSAAWNSGTLSIKTVDVPGLNTTAFVGSTEEVLCSTGVAVNPPADFVEVNDLRCQQTCFQNCVTNALSEVDFNSLSSSSTVSATKIVEDQESCLTHFATDCKFSEFQVDVYPAELACAKAGGLMQVRFPADLANLIYSNLPLSQGMHLQLQVDRRTQNENCHTGKMPVTLFPDDANVDRCKSFGGIPEVSDQVTEADFIHVANSSLMIFDLSDPRISAPILAGQGPIAGLSFVPYGCCAQDIGQADAVGTAVIKLFMSTVRDFSTTPSEGTTPLPPSSGIEARFRVIRLLVLLSFFPCLS
eukprot:Gregarina_sp_Poly_1__3997@NODE_2205_length_2491_cov_148_092409_g1420_i0_p1_GENE_NODE_2205_length_2491_cov_148_092409_g1420_i0NODE_2205_length_2491_cov_148_092409_g1420_i0_p1_ORF_typecomplete_len316_score30_59LVIVD/PF08309_11/0_24_NODE_2205_length_2491_cov_148_092409_g1420_i017964